MVLDKLGDSLKNTLQKITKSVFIDEKLINELVKDIQRALLQSDTNVQLVFNLSTKIKERAKDKTPPGITKREHLVKIVYEELTNFLGKESSEIKITKKPTQIMLVGLFGSGKTTTTGKLAKYYKKRGYKVAAIQTDTWRPAAYEQLKQLCETVGIDFFGIKEEKDPVNIYMAFEKKFKDYDIIL
ncbi:signal recognition particle protein Srp19, partial [Candidatus Woesearchaeota archaeon]|nr:signal recognition particle protein Srp19 [Candidatus Woesearchaeota archaeon]